MSVTFDSSHHFLRLSSLYRADEGVCLDALYASARLSVTEREQASLHAFRWIEEIRRLHKPQANVTDILSRYGLTSHEGLALMCLAEALLRIPDRATAEALIRDKLGEAHWNEALGQNSSWSINAATWALAITGKIIQFDNPTDSSPGHALGKLVSKLGQPVIREAILVAMEWLADQFVTGETIQEALGRTLKVMKSGIRYSFDMLGEGARCQDDANRYYNDYLKAIKCVGEFQKETPVSRAPGISIKLSALHPRYEMVQRPRILKDLVPKIVELCELAARYSIPVTIDAEEAERLQLSLEVAHELMKTANLGKWEGLGFAVQAYQKRAPGVIDYFIDLSRHFKRRIHIRLVKGAYWDTEIKRSQEKGWQDFPVYTRKASTDVSYLACARRMLDAKDCINPVFGTHNAMTAAHILELSKEKRVDIEFQRLHGMGEELHALMQLEGIGCCVYAPVGNHNVLLGYLVRRILENGANSSFVHRLLNPKISIEDLIRDPVDEIKSHSSVRHPNIRMPQDLYLPERVNSRGMDLTDPYIYEPLIQKLQKTDIAKYPSQSLSVVGPSIKEAHKAFPDWSNRKLEERCHCLEVLADCLERECETLLALLIVEAKKTLVDALSEVREAVDFCRYYAMRARQDLKTIDLQGPTGERNTLKILGRGVFICISPWNFPLAITLGQIAAALVVGNCVISKPAPQTPRIALYLQKLLYQSGIPSAVFQVCTGGPEVGAELISDPLIAGVAFTGSTLTANIINRALAAKPGPIIPFIAETGGQNALIVDSSALPEQVVDDVVTSSFRSAGQRCSALRVLCLPEVTADKILFMLKGAIRELVIGDPLNIETDVGPVIDEAAHDRLRRHIEKLEKDAKAIFIGQLPSKVSENYFVAPQAWLIPSIEWLQGEVFGPILHIVRYENQDLHKIVKSINSTGYGLTGGVHSRIDSTVELIQRELNVGNFYVNRSLIGAVVGCQPFGGNALSGTGPKAGGPHYLMRFAREMTISNNITAAGGNASLLTATS